MKTIDEAINYAAGGLPEDYNVNIIIENGGYNVELDAPDIGIRRQIIGMSEQSIIDDIIVATDTAKNMLAEQQE